MIRHAKPKYEVCIGRHWYRCKIAKVETSGWLHYELLDGTIGLAQPNKWQRRGVGRGVGECENVDE